ncbi:MAG: hypothetical protein US76_03870 [Parcubacteria group bacterium GW2011_GWA2_38_13b]|nr:MAG: hypothetical protein US76_03870 [Parcubacteria group bacterium GW2011_GWA2_38_13b]
MEIKREEIIIPICSGGYGSEAEVFIQVRNVFPGIGGKYKTNQVLTTAIRKEYNSFSGAGHRMFLKHLIIKKMDDYFCRLQKYLYPHITRPLGSVSNGDEQSYLYEWIDGRDGFPWEYVNLSGNIDRIILAEFNEFIMAFDVIGIKMGCDKDITNADDGRMSQNIVHELYYPYDLNLNLRWKRIDFGDRSIGIDYEKLAKFLNDESRHLQEALTVRRFSLLIIACQYLSSFGKISEKDKGKLEELTSEYRESTLRHAMAQIINPRNDHHDIHISDTCEYL